MPHQQTIDELRQHLQEQVGFLKASIAAYDSGEIAEGKRLASGIRTFVHDTGSSHSLLGQLRMKSISFFDTAEPESAVSIGSYHGLIFVPMGTGAYVPVCYAPREPYPRVSFDDWWVGKSVVVDGNGNRFSRRDLVLAVANKDGGSHVDPALDDRYKALSRDNSLGWTTRTYKSDSEPFEYAPLACIRQIAQELLLSVGETPPAPPKSNVSLLGGITFIPMQAFPKAGRNNPCPCGAKKADGTPVKYKRCHGR